AVVAGEAVPGVPPDADALAGLPPLRDVLSHGVDHTDHLVPRDAREGDAGPVALLGHRVAVADAAGLNLDPHGPWSRVGDRALDELEGPAGARDLGDTHRGPELRHPHRPQPCWVVGRVVLFVLCGFSGGFSVPAGFTVFSGGEGPLLWGAPSRGGAWAPPRAQVGWFSGAPLREFEVRQNGYEP